MTNHEILLTIRAVLHNLEEFDGGFGANSKFLQRAKSEFPTLDPFPVALGFAEGRGCFVRTELQVLELMLARCPDCHDPTPDGKPCKNCQDQRDTEQEAIYG